MKNKKPNFFTIVKQAAGQASDNKTPAMGAALAFYSILSLGPLLLLLLAGASLIFDHDLARNRIMDEFSRLIGDQSANTFAVFLNNSSPGHKNGTTILGVATLLFGASGVFGQLQDALNTIWQVKPREGAVMSLIWQRFVSFSMILGTGFLLLVSLTLSAALTAVKDYTTALVPGFAILMQGIDILISFGLTAFLFALIFKFVPDAKTGWRSSWAGGALTSLLFTLGKFMIGLYLGKAGVASSYGAAGSMVVILLWVYYSSQILLFGAEFTYAHAHGALTRSAGS
jgi:membrane protein